MSTKARIRAFAAATLAGVAILTSWGLSLQAGRPAHGAAQAVATAAAPTAAPPPPTAAPPAPTASFDDDEFDESD
jgi:hypothetical protein